MVVPEYNTYYYYDGDNHRTAMYSGDNHTTIYDGDNHTTLMYGGYKRPPHTCMMEIIIELRCMVEIIIQRYMVEIIIKL